MQHPGQRAAAPHRLPGPAGARHQLLRWHRASRLQLSDAEDEGRGRLAALLTIQECCAADLAQRVLATDSGAYSALLRLAGEEDEPAIRCQVLVTLAKVMDTNPDHLEAQRVELMHRLLTVGQDTSVTAAVLDWILTCCVRHEANRVAIVERPGLLARLAEMAGAVRFITHVVLEDAEVLRS